MSENKELIPKDTDDSLDTLLENMKLTQPEDLDELIEKRVNRRIRQIVLKVLAVILIPVIMIRMVISPLMNAMNINPDQMNRDFETDESGNIILESTLYRTLDAWIETQFPYTELDLLKPGSTGQTDYSMALNFKTDKNEYTFEDFPCREDVVLEMLDPSIVTAAPDKDKLKTVKFMNTVTACK